MPPVLIVCMGVCGAGKSTYARLVSDTLNIPFIEADDIHSESNKQKMRSGIPLTDTDREPWMEDICTQINAFKREYGCVIAHSALRRKHRDQLRSCGLQTFFMHFRAPKDLIEQRMHKRKNHYMPVQLIDSQFQTLEPTSNEADVIEMDASLDVDRLMEQVLHHSHEIKQQIACS